MNKLYLKEFRELFRNHYWNVLSGGKGAGKSYQIALYLTIKLLQDSKRNIVVGSRYIKTNQDTTYPAIKKAINVLTNHIPNLIDNFKFTTQPLKITYLPTGQIIKFVSFEKIDTTSSISTDDPNTYFDTIWFEELISADDINKAEGGVDDDIGTNERNILTMINSVIRFDKNNINHKKAKPQVIFSNNAWLPEYWLIKKYIDRYTPTNELLLQNLGSQTHVDINKTFDLGKGLFVSRTNALINPAASLTLKDEIREGGGDDISYAMLLGATQRIGGNFLAPVLYNLKNEIPNRAYGEWKGNETFKILSTGVDLGFSTKGDATTCYLHASSLNRTLDVDYKQLYILDEYYHSNRTHKKKSTRLIAAEIILKHFEWGERYNEMKDGVICYVDANNIPFLETLQTTQRLMNLTPTPWLIFTPVKEKYLKDNRVGNRYLFLREMISKGLLTISTDAKQLLIDLPQLPFDPKRQTKRRHTDDTVDGMMYSILPYMHLYKVNNNFY